MSDAHEYARLFGNPEPWKPWQEHSQASQDSAFALKRHIAAAQRESVFQAIVQHPDGLTDQEIGDLLGLAGDSVRPRRGELHNKHRIKEAGTRKTRSGRDATVWVAIEAR